MFDRWQDSKDTARERSLFTALAALKKIALKIY